MSLSGTVGCRMLITSNKSNVPKLHSPVNEQIGHSDRRTSYDGRSTPT